MAPKHFGLVLLIALAWGSNFVVAKTGMESFAPLTFAFFRFAFLAILLIPFLQWQPGQMRTILAIAMFSGALHFALFFGGLAFAPASVSAVVAQLNAPFALLVSIVFLGETVRWRRWFGMGLAFFGVVVLSFDPAVFNYIGGILLMAASALMYAFSQLFMKRLEDVGVWTLQAWIGLMSLPVLLLLSLAIELGEWSKMFGYGWLAWGAVLYTTLAGSIIGHGGVYYLLQRYDMSLIAPQLLLAPCVGILMSVWLLNEPFTARMVFGSMITLAGVGILALRQKAGQKITVPEVP